MEKLGILGGMGPMAGAYFYTRLVANTVSENDRGHIPVILLGDPRIPDRSASILKGDEKALGALLHGIDFLERSGADVIAIPCNTAHAYLDAMRRFTKLPILDMPRLGVAYACACRKKNIGILSTRGCRVAGVYERAAEELGARTVVLSDADALEVEALIYRQKAGEKIEKAAYSRYLDALYERGADCAVLACTEISCAFGGSLSGAQVDALEVLAKTAAALFSGRISEVEVHAFLRAAAI